MAETRWSLRNAVMAGVVIGLLGMTHQLTMLAPMLDVRTVMVLPGHLGEYQNASYCGWVKFPKSWLASGWHLSCLVQEGTMNRSFINGARL